MSVVSIETPRQPAPVDLFKTATYTLLVGMVGKGIFDAIRVLKGGLLADDRFEKYAPGFLFLTAVFYAALQIKSCKKEPGKGRL